MAALVMVGGTCRYYHYWFVESEGSPKSDPVALWLVRTAFLTACLPACLPARSFASLPSLCLHAIPCLHDLLLRP